MSPHPVDRRSTFNNSEPRSGFPDQKDLAQLRNRLPKNIQTLKPGLNQAGAFNTVLIYFTGVNDKSANPLMHFFPCLKGDQKFLLTLYEKMCFASGKITLTVQYFILNHRIR